ncbi:MAG: YqaJ viral recombinase family protein [Candidatus Eisenbacteria bacterium]
MTPETMSIEVDEAKERWLQRRRTGIGGSDAPVVMGLSPYKGPLQLYCEKLGIGELPNVESEAAEWGILLEEPVAAKYARATGRKLLYPGPYTIQRSEAYPFAICTLDRVIVADPPENPDRELWKEMVFNHDRGVLQIKTTGATHEDDWVDGPPPHVYCQVQHEMAVTGYQWASVAVLIGGQKFRWCDVARDEAYIAQLMEAEAAFWRRVETEDPPEPGPRDGRTLAALYPTDSGAVIELPPEALQWDVALESAKAREKDARYERETLEARLKAALKDASIGVLPNGVKYTLKSQTRAAYVCPESTFRVLRRSTK